MRTPHNVAHDHAPGFTLVELLIVVAIIAALAASAVPSFVDYIRRGRITEAVARLSDYRVRMEQYFLDNRRYDDGAGNCGAVAPVATPADAFSVACAAAATGYAVTATGLAAKGMQGFVYTIDHANARRTTAVPNGWVASDICWVVRRDGSCV
jgi:type IV pilus assembly protein PilE